MPMIVDQAPKVRLMVRLDSQKVSGAPKILTNSILTPNLSCGANCELLECEARGDGKR